MTRRASHEAEWGMTAASPWSVKGIDPKAREMAKDLARRSGMTLGEWLNQMITDGEIEPPPHEPGYGVGYRGVPARDYMPPEMPDRTFDGRAAEAPAAGKAAELQRIARALDQLSARMEAAENRSTLAISGIDQSVMGVLSRLEAVERDQGAVAARFDGALDDMRRDHDRAAEKVRRMADEDAPRVEAMKALEGALGKLAEKLYEGEGKTRGVLNELREDFSNLSRRVDRTDAKVEAEPAAALVDAVVARLGARLEQAETRTSDAVKALEQSFADLDARLRASEVQSEAEIKLERLASELSEKVADARAEMADRLKEAADGKLDRMEQALRDLAGHVEQGERRSAQAIDRMGREVMRVASTLGDRVGKVEARSAEAAEQIGGEMARIADAMEKRLARQDTAQAEALDKLGGEITRIAEKLAERIANSERRSTQTIEDVGEQLGRVTERLNQRYDRAQSELADRIQQSEARTAKLLEEAGSKFDARFMDAQRRAALEAAQDVARRAALAEEPQPARGEIDDLGDPFAADPAPIATHDPFAEPPSSDPFDTPASVHADPFAAPPPPFSPEPPAFPAGSFAADGARATSSTREMLEQARAAMRAASDGAEARGRRGDKFAGAVPVPPFEGEPSKLFGFGLSKRKKKEGVTLRTALAASGTAAALAVTGAGAVLLINAESAPSSDHGGDRFGVAPTAVADNQPPAPPPSAVPLAAAPGAPTQAPAGAQMAVAITPPPGQVEGAKAPAAPSAPAAISTPVAAGASSATTPAAVRVLYSSAVRLIESGDLAGVNDLKKAANLGHPPAQFYLAKLYETGGAGLTKDLVEARRWTERAAENGDVSAMHNLGLYYYEGEAGAQDPAKAAQWFQRAANLGVKDSQYNLAMLYAKGYGVPKNTAEAYKWYLVAAAAGDQGAKDAAQTLRPQLTPDTQAAAERAAAAFHVQSQVAAIRTASAKP
jgi:localization factor PodJL